MKILLYFILFITGISFAQGVSVSPGAPRLDPDPNPSTLWNIASLGDACGSIVEESFTELTHYACGTDDIANIDYAYQTSSTAEDVRITCKISNPTGVTENFTGAGVFLRETQAGNPQNDYVAQIWNFVINNGSVRSKLIENQIQTNPGIAINSIGFNNWLTVQYDVSLTDIEFGYSTDNITHYKLDTVDKTLTFPIRAGVFGTSHSNIETVVFSTTECTKTDSLLTLTNPEPPPPSPDPSDRSIEFFADFETGQLQPVGLQRDGIGFTQLTDNPTGECSIDNITKANPGVVTYSGCSDPGDTSKLGFVVEGVAGMTQMNGRLIRPCLNSVNEAGNTFEICVDNDPLYTPNNQDLVCEAFELDGTCIDRALDTSSFGTYQSSASDKMVPWISLFTGSGGLPITSPELCHVEDNVNTMGADTNISPRNGTYFFKCEIRYNLPYETWGETNPKNKPRYGFSVPSETDFNWDTEVWMGFSIYVPSDMEEENSPTKLSQEWYGNMVFTIVGRSASRDQVHIRILSQNGDNRWVLRLSTNPESIYQNVETTTETRFDLGSVVQGGWTDFVIRFRNNPWDSATYGATVNPYTDLGITAAPNQTYNTDKGILQVWMGPQTDPQLTLVVSKVNEPVGLVFENGYQLRHTYRNYKYGWHHNDTDMQNPIITGWDDIRFGEAIADGTGYSDVHPDGDSQP